MTTLSCLVLSACRGVLTHPSLERERPECACYQQSSIIWLDLVPAKELNCSTRMLAYLRRQLINVYADFGPRYESRAWQSVDLQTAVPFL